MVNNNYCDGCVPRIAVGISVLVILLMATGAGAVTPVTFYTDDFNGSALSSAWTVINKNSDSRISLTGTGYLRINASPKNGGSDYYNGSNYNAPRILRNISAFDSGYGGIIETKMIFSPTNNYQGAGILLCSESNPDSNTCFRATERAFFPLAGGSVVRSGGNYVGYTNSITYFRIMKKGANGKGWFSSNGVDWVLNGEGSVNMPLKYAGLFTVRQPWDGATNVYSRADFDYFNIIVFNGTTHTVDDSGGADYRRIQDAIDNATAGDTILVYSGRYRENVNVNKRLILRGIDSNRGGKPVVDANRKAFGILINASGVTLDGFEIINSSGYEAGAGIVATSKSNKIINNKVSNNSYGIMLLNSSYNTVENNIANNNKRFKGIVNGPPASTGIIVLGSHNIIRKNNASSNFYGISVFSGRPDGSVVSINNTIDGNTVMNNIGINGPNQPPSNGIFIGGSNNNNIRNNLASKNNLGVLIAGSYNNIKNNDASKNSIGIAIFGGNGIISVRNTLTGNKASGNSDRGVLLDNTSSNTISGNNASYNGGGILLAHGSKRNGIINNAVSSNSRWGIDISDISTDNNQITNNTANRNGYNGINLNFSKNNIISGNIANGNGRNGIWLDSSNNNTVLKNKASSNRDNGIVLHSSSNRNTLMDNIAVGNRHGIYLKTSGNNTLSGNNASGNFAQGIVINSSKNNILLNNNANSNNYNGILVEYYSSHNMLTGNKASNHSDSGIHLDKANNNTIINNYLSGNRNNGVQLYNSSNNLIYHNSLIKNIRNAYDNSKGNSWNSGYPSGGNYWSDYTGTDLKKGANQDQPGSDGIGDTPYNISGGAGAKDRYPLMKPWVATAITVIMPNGGETWARGTTKLIRWNYSGSPGSRIKIELLKNGLLNRTINSSYPIGKNGSGSYSWFISSTQAPGRDYKVRITSTTNSAYTDTSNNNFTISGGISVSSPNGGETWARGTKQTIRWTYSGTPGSRVKIELMKGGVLNRTINSSTSSGSNGSGSYSWLINPTQILGSDYRVRVTSTSNSAYTDSSNYNFTISI